ncbi:MAG TPA: hypothetical protein VMU16_10790 [Candidatus Binataceae bacterium]|nr:hypothetical protein [Candidatus Binataceae bacterium]
MSPIEITAIVFASVFGGAMLGVWLRTIIPEHHLSTDTKDTVKLGVGLIGTMSALVLGLMVATAKSSYDTRSNELTQLAADAILLDRLLAHYGPETAEVRGMLKAGLARLIDLTWPKDGASADENNAPSAAKEIIFDKIEELTPRTESQHSIQSQAESIAIRVWQTRWLLFEQGGSSISTPFLVVVVFWLTILFVSFGLFAPRNATVIITMLVSAMSVSGAIFLILELDQPFTGLIKISSAPLVNVLAMLGK